MYYVAHRSHTVHETKMLTHNSKVDISSMIDMAIRPGLIYTMLLMCTGWALEYVLAWNHYHIGAYGRFIGLGLGLGLAFPLIIRYYTGDRFMRRIAKEQLAERSVQEIIIKPTAVFETTFPGTDEPVLAFQVDDWTIMVLHGNWLLDQDNYELDGFNETSTETWNGLADPYAFPSTEFTIGRSVVNGMVLSVRPQGQYLAPKKRDVGFDEPDRFRECEFIHADLGHAHLNLRIDSVTEPQEQGHDSSGLRSALVAKGEDSGANRAHISGAVRIATESGATQVLAPAADTKPGTDRPAPAETGEYSAQSYDPEAGASGPNVVPKADDPGNS